MFHFPTRILNSTHTKEFNFVFALYMSRCPTINFRLSIMSKWLCQTHKYLSFFKITIRKRHVYIDILWPWKWNQYFYFRIWNDERTKIIFLNSFQLVTRLNPQNRNETILLLNSDTLFCILMFGISNWHKSSFDSTKMKFLTLFQFLTRLLTSNHFNLMST